MIMCKNGSRALVVRRGMTALSGALVVWAVLLSCATTKKAKEPTPAVESLSKVKVATQSEGQKLMQERCTRCHGTAAIKMSNIVRRHWAKTVDHMIRRGAQLNEAERKAVIDYLEKR